MPMLRLLIVLVVVGLFLVKYYIPLYLNHYAICNVQCLLSYCFGTEMHRQREHGISRDDVVDGASNWCGANT